MEVKLEHLTGKWSLEREIFDHQNQRKSRMTGSASFSPTRISQTLFYREELSHQVDGVGNFSAWKQYLYQIRDRILSIYFDPDEAKKGASPELFVKLPIDNPQGIHWCGDDEYRVKIIELTPNLIQMEIRVLGSRKNYSAVTCLTK